MIAREVVRAARALVLCGVVCGSVGCIGGEQDIDESPLATAADAFDALEAGLATTALRVGDVAEVRLSRGRSAAYQVVLKENIALTVETRGARGTNLALSISGPLQTNVLAPVIARNEVSQGTNARAMATTAAAGVYEIRVLNLGRAGKIHVALQSDTAETTPFCHTIWAATCPQQTQCDGRFCTVRAEQAAASCGEDRDCGGVGFCRANICHAWQVEGGRCEGGGALASGERCGDSLRCVPQSSNPNAPGLCLPTATIEAVVSTPALHGRKLALVDANNNLRIALGTTDVVCAPEHCETACCQQCDARIAVANASRAIALAAENGAEFGSSCRGTSCDYRNHCGGYENRSVAITGRYDARQQRFRVSTILPL